MARLPEPVCEEVRAVWGEGYKDLQDSFFKIIGQAIRKRSRAEKKKGEEKEDKD